MSDSIHVPDDGDWPCQQPPLTDQEVPPRLLSFLYRLLRDGAQAPGDVEAHAIQAALGHGQAHAIQAALGRGQVRFTNCHLEAYARSLAAHLMQAST